MAVSKVVKSNGDVIMDISQDNVNPNNLLQGGTAHGSDGEEVQGAVIVAPTDVTEVSDTTPYLYKSSEHDAVYDEFVGGSVTWNQLVANSGSSLSVTITSGHKYAMKKSGTLSVSASNGSAITGLTGGTDWITDLTLMFGTTIADYVYNLEQSTAGSGVEWLKSYGFFTKDYYAYNAGGLVSVNVNGKKVVGKNNIDLASEHSTSIGNTYTYNTQDGEVNVKYADGYAHQLVLQIPNVTKLAGHQITLSYDTVTTSSSNVSDWRIFLLTYINGGSEAIVAQLYSSTNKSVTVNLNSNITEMRLLLRLSQGAHSTSSDWVKWTGLQLELGSTATNYEPYTSLTYPIQSTDLRGLYKLSGSKLYTDGDIYSADGTVTRKYGYRDYQSGDESLANAITDGTHTIYKLSAPTTAPAPPFTAPQMVYRSGTEEYLDTRDVPIPVGGNRKYVDIPEWMINEYFDDVRSSASGAIEGDLIFDESSSAHGHGLISSDNKKAIVFNHNNIELTSSSGNGRGYIDDGDEITTVTLRPGDFEVSAHRHNSQAESNSSYLAMYPDGIEISVVSADDGIIVSGLDSGTGVNLVIAPDGTIYKASSSRDVKHDIEYVKDTKSYHDALMQLKPATFIYNSDKTETQKLGMIAEDVADACPIAGMTDKGGKVENYDDRAIIAMLVAEVQRLNAEIEKLKGR